jgi:chromosome segregation ATPase
MSDDDTDTDGLRERITKQGEDTLGKMADDLLANPLVSGAISRAFEAREKAASVQEATLAALNLPSAADIERLTRRVRSVSQRLEGIEDGIDRLDERLTGLAASTGIETRLDAIENRLEALMRELVALRAELPGVTEPIPSRQERLKVSS